MLMELDPTGAEALLTAVCTLLGLGAGVGLRRGKAEATSDQLTKQLAELAAQQSKTTQKLAEIVNTLDRFVAHDLAALDRSHRRLAADVDNIGDALELLLSHVGGELPKGAQESIIGKLIRRHHQEVTGAR